MKRGLKKVVIFLCVTVLILSFCGCLKNDDGTTEETTDTSVIYGSAELKDLYALTEEELERSIESYGEEEGYGLYKRAYYTFLGTKNYRVLTTGYSKVDTLGGINVIVTNEKKFDGTFFYMHVLSLAEKSNIITSLSNRNSKHYFYISKDQSENVAKVNQLEPRNDSKITDTAYYSEREYVNEYGGVPYCLNDYVINENTVTSSKISFDSESILYKIEFVLEPVTSTENLVKKMNKISETNAYYDDGEVLYTVYVDSAFTVRRTVERERYKVKAPLVGLVSAEGMTDDRFYYTGDEKFEQLSDGEKYQREL